MQTAMLVEEALKLKKKRWAIVYPNYEYGQSAIATFKTLMKARQPDIEFVAEQAPALGKIDAGSVVQALADAKPDAIFNVLFATDLGKFVREGNTRGLFKGREVVGLLTAEPEYLDPLKKEAPIGWTVTGYPGIPSTPRAHRLPQGLSGQVQGLPAPGYHRGLQRHPVDCCGPAQDQGRSRHRETDCGLQGPGSRHTLRPHHLPRTGQPVHHGAYVGKTAYDEKLGRGVLVDYRYADGKNYQPTDEEVKKLRPATAN